MTLYYQCDKGAQLQSNDFGGHFWCDLCEKGFATQQILFQHQSEHVKCNINGCLVEGSPKFIENHVKLQHNNGIYERLMNLNSEEDLQKWREERKKRYPTKENVALRQLAQAEKLKRGERLEASKSRFGKNRQYGEDIGKQSQHQNKERSKRKRKRNNQRSNTSTNLNDNREDELDEDENPKRNKFLGTSTLTKYKHKSIETNALANILGMYGSDDSNSGSDEDEETTEGNLNTDNNLIVAQVDLNNSTVRATIKDNLSDTEEISDIVEVASPDDAVQDECEQSDSDAPSEVAIEKSTDLPFPPASTSCAVNRNCNNRTSNSKETPVSKNFSVIKRQNKRFRQNTMLEKLLENDIRHERNVLLQCVRYAVENNFFDATCL